MNLYAYCHNNPVEYVDPSGHKAGHPQHENAPADLKKNGMSEADANNQHKNLSGDGEGGK